MSLRASEVVVFDGRAAIARHQRVIARGGGQSLDLDHYLEVLRTKPGALPGASALAAARRNGTFTAAHDAFWAAARKTDGDAGGTRQLIDVLLLHRTIDSDDVIAGIEAALTVGAVTADVVAVEARRHASSEVDAGGSDSGRHLVARRDGREQRVVSLTQRRLADPAAIIAGLPADSRPAPTVDHYDQLLRLPRTPQSRPIRRPSRVKEGPNMVRPPVTVSTTLRRRGLTEEAATAAVDQACRRLRLPTIRAVVADAATAARKDQLSYYGFLAELLLSECDDRDRRSVVRRIKGAGFPREKWLADFDFDANPPNINPATIGTLATGDWIRKGQPPLCLIGGLRNREIASTHRARRGGRRSGLPRQIRPRHPISERARRSRRRETTRPHDRPLRPSGSTFAGRTRLHGTRQARC